MRLQITKAVIFFLAAFGLFTIVSSAQAETRKALIVANYEYGKFGTLNTPQNDGRLMEKTLLSLGFEVKRQNNLDRRDLKNELTNFIKAARLADVALIYYSGYQVTLDDKTYLTPVGEVPTSLNLAQLSMVSVEALMQRFSVAATQNVLIVEGGWKSPFSDELAKLVDKSAVEQVSPTIADLSQYKLGAGEGRLATIAASSVGKINPNEPSVISKFTNTLSEEISRNGESLGSAFSKTVSLLTDDGNGPAVHGELSQSLYLAGVSLVAATTSELNVEAERKWRTVRESNIIEEVEAFVDDYGSSRFGGIALEKLYELNRFDPAKRQKLRNATLEYRELSKQLIVERQKFEAVNTKLSKSEFAIKPILSNFSVSGNVAVRSKPSSDGEWLGLYKKGDVFKVQGSVIGKNWLQVVLKKRKGRKSNFGYIHVNAATLDPRSAYSVWQTISASPSDEGYFAYLAAFPDGYNRYNAVKALMDSKFPDVKLEVEAARAINTNVDIKGLVLEPGEVPQSSAIVQPALDDEPTSGNRRELIREMGFYLDVMEQEFVTTQEATLRRLPWVKTRIIATVKQDEKIVVTGRVHNENWYRVKWGGGRDLYVKSSSLVPFANSELAVWQDSENSGERADFAFYLQRFPNGRFADEAQKAIARIKASQQDTKLYVVKPNTLANEYTVPTNVLELINVQPVVYSGKIQASLSSALMHKFGRSLKLRVSSLKDAPDRTFLDVTARIVDVKINEVSNNGLKQQRYLVAVEVEATRYGEISSINATDVETSDFETGTSQSLAIQLTAKKAFAKAADQILAIMKSN